MRVRPFFWLLLAFTCIIIFVFAATVQTQVPAVMQVQLGQPLAAVGFTTVALHLADSEGLPIEEAQILSSAQMTNMYMVSKQSSVKYVGGGNYIALLRLYMAGPWAITIQVHAAGFEALHQRLLVQVGMNNIDMLYACNPTTLGRIV